MREQLGQDVRFGARVLLKSPGFAVMATVLLGVGIGAATAVFSLVNAVLLKPLPYSGAARIVLPWDLPPKGLNFGGYDRLPWDPIRFQAMQQETRTFEYLAAMHGATFNLTGSGEPALLEGLRVSWSFFPALDIRPELGRGFTAEEDQPGREREAILSDALWRARFNADRGIVGRAIDLNGQQYTVVGVMAAGLDFPRPSEMPATFTSPAKVELWVPIALPAETPRFTPAELAVVGRLRPGVTLQQAQAAMELFSDKMERLYPRGKGWFHSILVPLQSQMAGDTGRPLLLLLAAVAVVLLIVCLNVSGLVLTRALGRQHELAVRAALGASRKRIVRQFLTESLLLAFAGGIMGMALGWGGVWAVRRFGPATIPMLDRATLDVRVLAFVAAATLAVCVLTGLAPALGALRVRLAGTLNEGGQRSAGPSHPRLRDGLVMFQIALALALVIASGLLARTFRHLLEVDPGFRTEHVLTFELSLPTAHYPDRQRIIQFYRDALPRLRAVAGVESAAIAAEVPMGGAPDSTAILIPGRPLPNATRVPIVNYVMISPDFFRTMGTPMERGRDFADSDDINGQPVTIINRAMAQRIWPGEDAMGKQVTIPALKKPIIVAGIVDDIKNVSLAERPDPEMFVPYTQDAWPQMNIMEVVLRSRASPDAVISGARDALHGLDPGLPLAKVTTLTDLKDASLAGQRFSMVLVGFFGLFSLALAAVGIYGVVSLSVNQRRREIGIRMALGAQRGNVFRLVATRTLTLAAVGILLGEVTALGAGRVLTGYLYEVKAWDPLTYSSVAVVLVLVALAACAGPAQRAASIDPVRVLKEQ